MPYDLHFRGSSQPTLGIEVELQFINSFTRDLIPKASEVLDQCRKQNIQNVSSEIHCSMIEMQTGICKNAQECRQDLNSTLHKLLSITKSLDVKLAISGTHPFQKWTDRKIYPEERYLYLQEKYQWLIRRVNVHGMHVHVGVSDGDRAVLIANQAVRYLPHLLALSASSPFWNGIDTGLNSCRVGIMESFPISGLPPLFTNWKQLEEYAETLLKVNAISSLKEIYWHIRPNPQYGTIEFRICDGMSSLFEITAIATLIQALVIHLDKKTSAPSFQDLLNYQKSLWIAPQNLWRAARDGLNASLIHPETGTLVPIQEEIQQLLETLHPIAASLGGEEDFNILSHLLKTGNGAQKQREIFSREKNYIAIVDQLTKDLEEGVLPEIPFAKAVGNGKTTHVIPLLF